MHQIIITREKPVHLITMLNKQNLKGWKLYVYILRWKWNLLYVLIRYVITKSIANKNAVARQSRTELSYFSNNTIESSYVSECLISQDMALWALTSNGKQIRGIWIHNWIPVGSLNQATATSLPPRFLSGEISSGGTLLCFKRSNTNAVTAKTVRRALCRLGYLYETTKSRRYLKRLSALLPTLLFSSSHTSRLF